MCFSKISRLLIFKILFIKFLFGSFNSVIFCQNYEKYYSYTDRARLAYRAGNLQLADSCFESAFKGFQGFSNDYFSALEIKNKLYGYIDTNLMILYVGSGVSKIDFKFDLKVLGVQKNKFYDALYKKYRPKRSVKGLRFAVLMIRDQLNRSKNLKWLSKNADAKNALRLKKLISTKPELFDRNNIGWYPMSNLETLLMHQGNWDDAQLIFYKIRDFVSEGKIPKYVLLSMVHRSSMVNGALFTYDENSDSLIVRNNDLMCDSLYYFSNVHGNELRVRRNGIQYLPPLHPSLDTAEVNQIRKFIFQLDIETSFPDSLYILCTEEEYCNFFIKK